MDRTQKILRIGVGGQWSARQASQAIAAIDDLYNWRLMLQVMLEDTPEFIRHHFLRRRPFFPDAYFDYMIGAARIRPDRVVQLVEPAERLTVRRLDYASPGSFDFAGIGAIAGHLKDFVLKLIEIHTSAPQRALENEGRSLENESQRIKNARDYVALARELGVPEQEIRQQVIWIDKRQRKLESLVQTRLIVSAELLDGEIRER